MGARVRIKEFFKDSTFISLILCLKSFILLSFLALFFSFIVFYLLGPLYF